MIAGGWERASQWARTAVRGGRGRVLLVLAILLIVAMTTWAMRLAVMPTRRAGNTVSLEPYGYPGVELRLVYPSRVAYRADDPAPSVLTVYARALAPDQAATIDLVFPLPDETLAFVDAQGLPAPGRLTVQAGYPDALPHNLLLAHADTQFQPTLLRARVVRVTPLLQDENGPTPLNTLAFRTSVESRLSHTLRGVVVWFSGWGLLGLILLAIVGLGARLWHQRALARRQAREQQLSTLYTHLRDDIKVENWRAARERVEQVRLLEPAYRDLDHLDTVISTAETAAWRRDQLYKAGLNAYHERDWPSAVQAFSTIEEETPYYRDVRFLRRTAALNADLRSRDRSLRLKAAAELGQVADLVDMTPLLRALGDQSREVADAAEASFARIGVDAFDTLIEGLTADRLAVRERSYRLLEGLGQSARGRLRDALRSLDPRVTSAVARLLGALGARDVLAQSLIWVSTEHQACVIEALVAEDTSAVEPLVDTLLAAPEGRDAVVLSALAALKTQVDIGHYLDGRIKATEDPAARARLQRAARIPPQAFTGAQFTAEAIGAQPQEPGSPMTYADAESGALNTGATEADTLPARTARRRLWPSRRDS